MKKIFLPLILFLPITVFSQWSTPDAANRIYYSKGFVGVGALPLYRFHIKSTDDKPLFYAETSDASFSFNRHVLDLRAKSTFAQTPYVAWHAPSGKRQAYIGWRSDVFNLTLENNFTFSINGGNVGIGTDDTKGYLLAIGGKAIAEEVVVKLKGNWPDYVFNESYKLLPLDSVRSYIQKYKRLPDVPSNEETARNGINLNEMTATLLRKVEELTLYLLREEAKSKVLGARLDSLKNFCGQYQERK